MTMLEPSETRALCIAVGFMTAGEADGVSVNQIAAAESAQAKLDSAPRRNVWLSFSQKELGVLWDAITNGAEGVLQTSAGQRPDQRAAFREAANRIADAGKFGPRF